MTFAATAAAHHFQFSHFWNRKKMLKSNNQKKVSQLPQPGLAVLNGSDDHTGRKKKRKRQKKKNGGKFLA